MSMPGHEGAGAELMAFVMKLLILTFGLLLLAATVLVGAALCGAWR